MKKDFICPECNKPRKNARMDAEVCSSNCRIKKLRRIKKEEREANSPLNKIFKGPQDALNKLTIK